MHPNVVRILDIKQPVQRSEEWYTMRREMLTASDVPAALGENEYKTRLQLVLEKVFGSTFSGNDATRHGQAYEDEAIAKFDAEYNKTTIDVGLIPHQEYSFLGGSPDGLTETNELIEVKCPMRRKITNEVPKHYLAQIYMCQAICGVDTTYFIQYRPDGVIPGNMEGAFEVTVVKYPTGWFEEHLETFRSFWLEVCTGRENPESIRPQMVTDRSAKGFYCKCGEYMVYNVVKKEGPNRGRPFLACPKGRADGGCGSFNFMDPKDYVFEPVRTLKLEFSAGAFTTS